MIRSLPESCSTSTKALRILSALEDARDELASHGLAISSSDELVTMIRLLHVRLGWEEGEWR